jgi:C_GCAxxG_C_C family probable redox protein
MSEKVKKALELFDSGFNCSQAVVGAFCGDFEVDEKLLMKLASGFGGGLRCGEVCGAVSGSVMILGLKYGQDTASDKVSKENCYHITSEFIKEYVERKGTILCRELLGYDIRDSEARERFPGRQKEVCPKAIETAVLLLEEMGL